MSSLSPLPLTEAATGIVGPRRPPMPEGEATTNDAAANDAAANDATTNDATTGEATTNDATTGEATTREAATREAATTSEAGASETASPSVRRPGLHDRICCVRGPVSWVSPASGQAHNSFDGLYVADRRALASSVLTVNGREPEMLAAGLASAERARFVGEVASSDSSDPVLFCTRWRTTTNDGGIERITVESASPATVAATVRLRLGTDLTSIHAVARGEASAALPPQASPHGLHWRAQDGARVRVSATPDATVDIAAGTLTWQATLKPGQPFEAEIRVLATYPAAEARRHGVAAVSGPPPWASAPVTVQAGDWRLGETVRGCESDLGALLLSDPLDPGDVFFAAGSPWYLTLFGRDSIWAARLALALGHEPLLGALRALARRQGTRLDRGIDEEPGKILHEVRSSEAGVWRAPVYYGSVDATPLFVSGVADALRWGAPPERIDELMPAVEAALAWMVKSGDIDNDAFLEYRANESGLANQSWKDSRDGVQWHDGRLAQPPLALSEVQAYAYRAALDGAWLLAERGRPGAAGWLEWAAALRARFLTSFIITDEWGSYPAIALDANKQPVDGPASNMGHLVGTGILTEDLEQAVAARLLGEQMACGFGIRTLARTARGYNPLGYHTGSVWPHDNAIAMLGFARAGRSGAARQILCELLAAAPHFGYRFPELYGGHPATSNLAPVPYPAACRPQAWSAAAGLAMLTALLGMEPDATKSSIRLRPMRPSPVGAYRIRNIRVCGGRLAVSVDAGGEVTVEESPAGITVTVADSEAAAEPPAIAVPASRRPLANQGVIS